MSDSRLTKQPAKLLLPLLGVLFAVLSLLMPTSSHAERLLPPIELLFEPTNLLISGKVIEINTTTSRVVFRFGDLLAGERKFITQELIDVLVTPEALRAVVVDQRYIVGYTLFAEDNRHPGQLVGKREGPTLLVGYGVDPALFKDTPQVRRLIATGKSESRRESRATLSLLLDALDSKDVAVSTLAAAQIALERELHAKIKESERKRIERFVRNADAAPAARDALLTAAAEQPAIFGANWPIDVSNDLLLSTPIVGYSPPSTEWEILIRDAIAILDKSVEKAPERALIRWLSSDSVGLAETALQSIRQQYPQSERSAVNEALGNPDLAPATRTFLNVRLERMGGGNAPARGGSEGG
jgi:hypothetical protein